MVFRGRQAAAAAGHTALGWTQVPRGREETTLKSKERKLKTLPRGNFPSPPTTPTQIVAWLGCTGRAGRQRSCACSATRAALGEHRQHCELLRHRKKIILGQARTPHPIIKEGKIISEGHCETTGKTARNFEVEAFMFFQISSTILTRLRFFGLGWLATSCFGSCALCAVWCR